MRAATSLVTATSAAPSDERSSMYASAGAAALAGRTHGVLIVSTAEARGANASAPAATAASSAASPRDAGGGMMRILETVPAPTAAPGTRFHGDGRWPRHSIAALRRHGFRVVPHVRHPRALFE